MFSFFGRSKQFGTQSRIRDGGSSNIIVDSNNVSQCNLFTYKKVGNIGESVAKICGIGKRDTVGHHVDI